MLSCGSNGRSGGGVVGVGCGGGSVIICSGGTISSSSGSSFGQSRVGSGVGGTSSGDGCILDLSRGEHIRITDGDSRVEHVRISAAVAHHRVGHCVVPVDTANIIKYNIISFNWSARW